MLSRKHYRMLAKAINEAEGSESALIKNLIVELSRDNGRFNSGEFTRACYEGRERALDEFINGH